MQGFKKNPNVSKCLMLLMAAAFLSAAQCGGGSDTKPKDDDSGLVSKTADATVKWDPLGDDDGANIDDGKQYPDEAAIKNPKANASEKADAWGARAARLAEIAAERASLKAIAAADKASRHADYWDCQKAFKGGCSP